MWDKRMDAALDRYITGNYGEDQFKGCRYECAKCGKELEEEEIFDFDNEPCECYCEDCYKILNKSRKKQVK